MAGGDFSFYSEEQKQTLKDFAKYCLLVYADLNGHPKPQEPDHEFFQKSWRDISKMVHTDKLKDLPDEAPERSFLTEIWNMNQVLKDMRKPEVYAVIKNVTPQDILNSEKEVQQDHIRNMNIKNDFSKAFSEIALSPALAELLGPLAPKPTPAAPPPLPKDFQKETPPLPKDMKKPSAVPPPVPVQEPRKPQTVVEKFVYEVTPQELIDSRYMLNVYTQGANCVLQVSNQAVADALTSGVLKGAEGLSVKEDTGGKVTIQFNAASLEAKAKDTPQAEKDKIKSEMAKTFVDKSEARNEKFVNQIKTAVGKLNFSDEAKQGFNNLAQIIDNVKKNNPRSVATVLLSDRQIKALQDKLSTEMLNLGKSNQGPQAPKPEAKKGFMSFFSKGTQQVTPEAEPTKGKAPRA